MDSREAEIDGELIARSVAIREKALAILRSASRPPLYVVLAPFASMLVVSLGMAGLVVPFWPKVILNAACIIAFWSIALMWHLSRQLRALADLTFLAQNTR